MPGSDFPAVCDGPQRSANATTKTAAVPCILQEFEVFYVRTMGLSKYKYSVVFLFPLSRSMTVV